MNTMKRRAMSSKTGILATLAAGIAISQGCAQSFPSGNESGTTTDIEEALVTTTARVREATTMNGTTTEQGEHCRVPTSELNVSLPAGTQLMIYRTDGSGNRHLRGLCTVDTAGNAPDSGVNFYSLLAASRDNRVEISGDPASSEITNVEIRNETSTTTAPVIAERITSDVHDVLTNATDKVVEFVQIPAASRIAITAPHPTDRGTTVLAERIAEKPASSRAPSGSGPAIWAAGIDNAPKSTGTYDRYHITSTDISAQSFPGLDEIMTQGVTEAVAFHSNVDRCALSGSPNGYIDVLVGGGATDTTRQGIAELISYGVQADQSLYAVRINGCTNYQGSANANFINELTTPTGRGVQLEIREALLRGPVGDSNTERRLGRAITTFGENLADAVDQVHRCLTDTPDVTNISYEMSSPADGIPADAPLNTDYATEGACTAWIAEFQINNHVNGHQTAVFSSVDWANTTWDPVNMQFNWACYEGRGHLDLYNLVPAAGSVPAHYDRIGGGDFTTAADCNTTYGVTYGVRSEFPFIRANGGSVDAGLVAVGSSGSTTIRAVIRMVDATTGAPLPAGGIIINEP